MKSLKLLLRACGMFLFATIGTTICSAQATVRIMPLGDSLTKGLGGVGFTTDGGYRNRLYSLLTSAGYNVDFVGTQTDSNNPGVLPDKNHEGHGGYRINDIRNEFPSWFSQVEDPDVILLMIGTNDFSLSTSLSVCQDRIKNLLAELSVSRPYSKIVLGTLLFRSDNATMEANQNAFNLSLPALVSEQVSLGRQVSLIDLHGALTASDLNEGVHPNLAGYDKVAAAWLPGITTVISPQGTANPPAIARATPQADLTHVVLTFSKPVEDAAASLGNYSANNGLSISAAVLDSTKRNVTLTTGTQVVGTVYTVSVSGVRDRTAAQNTIAPGTTALFAIYAQTNGSFESDFSGWTTVGNMEIKTSPSYLPTDGAKLVAFNTGQSPPNGILSQTFSTTVGQTYQLTFDAGVFGFSTSDQRLNVSVAGSGNLLSQIVTVTGLGGGATRWVPQNFAFVANSAATTLTFTDVSTTSNNLDLVLDNVRLTPQLLRTFTLTSSPASGASITMSPVDVGGNSTGTTNFTRSYANGTTVLLTAPATAGANSFLKWQKNGADFSSSLNISVLADGNHTFNAVYGAAGPTTNALVNGSFEAGAPPWTTAGNLRIFSSSAATQGTALAEFNGSNSTPNGVLTQTFSTVPGSAYTLAFDVGVYSFNSSSQRLQVNVTGSGSLLSQLITATGNGNGVPKWSAQSFPFIANSSTTTLSFTDTSTSTVALDLYLDNVRVNGPPTSQRILTVNSSPATGVSVAVTPNDLNGDSGGSTQFTRSYADGAIVNLTAPATSGATVFSKWQKDGLDFSATAATSVTMNGSFTMTAVYVTPVVLPGLLVNGSFEDGENGWTMSGNRLNYLADANYVPYDGSKLMILNPGSSTPNAILSQSFATVSGQSYTLSLAVGVLGGNNVQQRLQVAVDGASSLVAQTVSLLGTGASTPAWTPVSFTFVANSASTILTLTDVSTTPVNADLLLDKVSVTTSAAAVNRTLTVVSTPATGVSITVSPNDLGSNGNGTTQFTRSYADGAVVSLTAPATSGAANFSKWQKDGADFSNTAATSVTMNASFTMTAVYVTPVVAPGTLVNGSFESGETGWIMTGNRIPYTADTFYLASDLANLMVLHGGNFAPDAVISQDFATTPGQTYQLSFDLGVFAINSNAQSLKVDVIGSSSLLSLTETINGNGAGTSFYVPKTYNFVANSATTTLKFTDTSASTTGIDLLLDNVKIGLPGAVVTRTLTVASTPANGVSITVSPNDLGANGNGSTQFTRSYNNGTVVSLTAPATSGATNFVKWQKNGVDFSNTAATSVTMDAAYTMTAVYSSGAPSTELVVNGSFESNFTGWNTTGNTIIQSALPYLPTDGSKLASFNASNTAPNGVLSQSFATVSGATYTLKFDAGALAYNTSQQKISVNVTGSNSLLTQTVTVGGTAGGNNNFAAQSFTFVADSLLTTLSFTDISATTNAIDLLLDKVSVTGAPSGAITRTLTVDSTPATGVSVTVSPNDLSSNGNGTTLFTRTYSDGAVVSLTAPANSGANTFVKWQKNGVDFSNTAATSVTMDAAYTMTAVYTPAPIAAVALVNGSFESDFTGWNVTGNAFI
ncbi:MAG: DUF642 domain-containing protein, partial [Luteolibacter sp.]